MGSVRTTTMMVAAAATAVVVGCNDPTTGGNVANGDRSNYPYHAPNPKTAGQRNPLGSDSGPWIGESGLPDTTTGVNDRSDARGTSSGSQAAILTPQPAAAADGAATPATPTAGGGTARPLTSDEQDKPAGNPGVQPANAQQNAAERR